MLCSVIVDSTLQHKAIAYPTDVKMLEMTARFKLVEAAEGQGVEFKQTFAKECNLLIRKARRYAHAKQYKRMRQTIKRQRSIVVRLQREFDREPLGKAARDVIAGTLSNAGRVFDQTEGKIIGGQPKLYTRQAPEVHCFSKGKALTPFEFGVKVIIAVSAKSNLIVGARAFTVAPFDGHTLHVQIAQTTILLQDRDIKLTAAVVDLGYRGVDANNPGLNIFQRGKVKKLEAEVLELIKRPTAIEPVIDHFKADHRMDRCHLKGEICDRLYAVLSAVGYNIRWRLRAIALKALKAFLRLSPATAVAAVMAWIADRRELVVFMRSSDPMAVA